MHFQTALTSKHVAIQRAQRVDDKNEEKEDRIPVKPKSADKDMYVGWPNNVSCQIANTPSNIIISYIREGLWPPSRSLRL